MSVATQALMDAVARCAIMAGFFAWIWALIKVGLVSARLFIRWTERPHYKKERKK